MLFTQAVYYSRQLYKTKHVIDQTHWGSLAPRSVITIDAFVVLYYNCSGNNMCNHHFHTQMISFHTILHQVHFMFHTIQIMYVFMM